MKKISEDIKCCPYCGGETYYIKQHYYGDCRYFFSFDERKQMYVDNGGMWEGATFRNTSKYAWCADCDKRLFKLE